MSEIVEIVDSIETKLKKLFSKIESLEQSNRNLRIELNDLSTKIDTKSKEIVGQKSIIESLKITNSLLGSDENKRETKLKINSLIREIDYCIAQLSD
jgi:chromosome segregation ATPase